MKLVFTTTLEDLAEVKTRMVRAASTVEPT
jgi:hypothetical protein